MTSCIAAWPRIDQPVEVARRASARSCRIAASRAAAIAPDDRRTATPASRPRSIRDHGRRATRRRRAREVDLAPSASLTRIARSGATDPLVIHRPQIVTSRPSPAAYPAPGVDSSHVRSARRPRRPRLPRQRRPDADRQVRRRAGRRAGGRARRRRDPGGRRAGGPAAEGTPIDEVLMGQVLQAGAGQAPARQAALRGRPARTRRARRRSTASAARASRRSCWPPPRSGPATPRSSSPAAWRSMNGAPYLLPSARFGYRLGNGELVDATVHDGLWCAIEGCHMGTHAERVAISNQVSREDQDAFALRSHQQAIAAIDAGRFDAEIAPVTVRDAKGRETVVTVDEGPRRDTTLEALARLKPVFALPDGEDRGDATDRHRHRRQRPGHHRRRGGDGRRQRAGRRAARPQAARPDRRLRPGRGRAEVAVPRPGRGRPPAARPDRAADRGVRPDRDQRGVRRPDPGRRPRARLRLGQGQRQRRRDRARPPDRGERGADRRDAAPRAPATRGPLRPGDALPRRRRLGRGRLRAGLTDVRATKRRSRMADDTLHLVSTSTRRDSSGRRSCSSRTRSAATRPTSSAPSRR